MAEKVTPRTLAGFMELLPQDQILFNQMHDAIKESYETFGFLPLDTPVLESGDVLLAKTGGETGKQIYEFNKGDSHLAMRFDLTVPLAKYVAMHQNELTFPFRRYQIGKVYRGERAQQGRFREFYQADIDIIGDGELSLMNDAEIPSVIYTTIKEMGFEDFTIRMNNRKILNGLFEHVGAGEIAADVMRTIDKLDKIGVEKVSSELEELGLSKEAISTIVKFVDIKGNIDEKLAALNSFGIENDTYKLGVHELEEVIKGVRLLGVPEKNFGVDLTIVRGLDYYTGTVYETFLNQFKEIGSVCSGGRYDNLSEFYTDRKMPGVGISIGLTRLFYQLNKMKLLTPTKESISDVLLIPMDDDLDFAFKTATALRKSGVKAEVYLENKKMKAKFAYADKLKIPYVGVIGETERTEGKVMLKDMKNGEQRLMTADEIVGQVTGQSVGKANTKIQSLMRRM